MDFRKDYLGPAMGGTKCLLEVAVREEGIKNTVITSTYGTSLNPLSHLFLNGPSLIFCLVQCS